MRPSTSSSILLLAAFNFTKGFAPPRPGYGIRSTNRSPLSRSGLLRATTLQEVDTTTSDKTDLPFYAEPVLPQTDDYEQSQESTLQEVEVTVSSSGIELPFFAEPDLLSVKHYQPEQVSSLQEKQETSLQLPNKKENKLAEFAGLASWITVLSSFLLVNNFIGPWPAGLLASIPVKAFGLVHAVSGMLFGGGIVLTTLIEWLATGSKNADVLKFYFDKVPKLDAFVVLPALTASIVSGVGLAVDHYGTLGDSPFHVVGAISTLLAFAIWWASTDVTTQGAAMKAIQEWTEGGNTENTDVPQIVQLRKYSNVVSCLFVAALYGFMVLKPGFTPPV